MVLKEIQKINILVDNLKEILITNNDYKNTLAHNKANNILLESNSIPQKIENFKLLTKCVYLCKIKLYA